MAVKRLNREKGRINVSSRVMSDKLLHYRDIWIFTEGGKTEPLYFGEIKHRICIDPMNRKGRNYNIVACNSGGNGVLKKARAEYRNNICFCDEADVFLVFDKDDISDAAFDGLVSNIENMSTSKHRWHAIWSNECFELWYLLHFEKVTSDIGRNRYFSKLDKYFSLNGVGNYGKNRNDIYGILLKIGNAGKAMINARWLKDRFCHDKPSCSVPCTNMAELMDCLIPLLPEEDRKLLLNIS